MRSIFLILFLLVINKALMAQTDNLKPGVEFNTPDSKTEYSAEKGIKNMITRDSIKIYPNPAFDYVNINTDDANPGYLVELFDITGKKIISARQETKTTTLDLREIHPGVYMIRLSGRDRVVTRRIVKK